MLLIWMYLKSNLLIFNLVDDKYLKSDTPSPLICQYVMLSL